LTREIPLLSKIAVAIKKMILIMSRFFTTGGIFEKGEDCNPFIF
jgi:hypothetical protein